MKISTSILGVENIKEEIKKIEKSGTDYIHLDVMDGKYVSNKVEYDKIDIHKPVDIHFMVEDVDAYIKRYECFHPEYMTFHIEVGNTEHHISEIKKRGMKVGISINPDTPIEHLKNYLGHIDLVLVMSVVPGRGGQAFMESVLPKIRELKSLQKQYHYVIEVDGGINDTTISKVKDCDIIVSGSYITKEKDYKNKIQNLKNKMV